MINSITRFLLENPKIQTPFTKRSQAQQDIISVLMENSQLPCSAIILDSDTAI